MILVSEGQGLIGVVVEGLIGGWGWGRGKRGVGEGQKGGGGGGG